MCVFLATFNTDFARLENPFQEMLVKSGSSHELSINLQKRDCHFEMKNRTES